MAPVDVIALEAAIARRFADAGASARIAAVVAAHLVAADRAGVHSHGVARVGQYLDEITRGELDPSAEPDIRDLDATRVHVDGRRGFGQYVARAMAEQAISVARRSGSAVITGHRMGHTGRIGSHVEEIAREGLLAIAVSSGPPSGHWVAPFGGTRGRLATNPLAYAVPCAGAEPIVADFSTSVVPEGTVRAHRDAGAELPGPWLLDAHGAPSRDPAVLYADPPGAIQPFGGDQGYRGTALAVLVEVLATLLAGDRVDDRARAGSNLAIIALTTDDGFAERARELGAHLRATPPINAGTPVILPGDRERAREHASRWVVELPGHTLDQLRKRGVLIPG